MPNINTLYCDILEALDLDVVDDQVMSMDNPVKVNKKPLVLFGDIGKRLVNENPNRYTVFNPIDEDRISGMNPELRQLMRIYQVRLNLAVKHAATGIMASLHEAPPLVLTPLMDELNKAKGNAKELVDDKLMGYFVNICNDDTLNVISVNMKHGLIVDGEKENSAIVVNTAMTKLMEDDNFMPSMRKKDRRVVMAIFEWLTTYLSSPDRVVSHSHNDDLPDFIAFYKMLVHISDKIKPIGKYTKNSGFYEPLVEVDLDLDWMNNIDELVLDSKLTPRIDNVAVSGVPQAHNDVTSNDSEVNVISTPEELFGTSNSIGGATVVSRAPTYAPAQPTYAPVQPTYAPVQPTYAPVQPTYAPVQPTYAPAQPTYNQPSTMMPHGIHATAHDTVAAGGSLFAAIRR